jgi:hypothetical protein
MKAKLTILVMFILVCLTFIFVSCSRKNNCMRFHNDDVKRGLAH